MSAEVAGAGPALDAAVRADAIDEYVRAYMAAVTKRRRRPTVIRFSMSIEGALAYLDWPEVSADHERWIAEGLKPARVRVSISAGRTRGTFSLRYTGVGSSGLREVHTMRLRVTFVKEKR